jgi:hypothetical protein
MSIPYPSPYTSYIESHDSTVSIVSGILAGWPEFQIPAGASHLSLLPNDSTGSEANPTSYSTGTVVLSRK